jgi:hypothetical protein
MSLRLFEGLIIFSMAFLASFSSFGSFSFIFNPSGFIFLEPSLSATSFVVISLMPF